VDVGGVVRIGRPGRLSLFGMSFSRELDDAGPPARPDSTVDYATLLAPYERRRNARVNVLWALRNIHYHRVQRFDALSAEQDVRAGVQLGVLLGRSLEVLGTTDDDILVAAEFYGATGNARTYARLNVRGEGRQDYDRNRWDGILGGGQLALYQRVGDRHTVQSSVEWSGGWRQRVPFQLALGSHHGGVRGYRRSRLSGARRAVMRLEDRWYLGEWREQVDVGLAVFADAGRLWAGDAPFGVNTPVKVGAGVGLLVALPRGSKRTWRLDLAVPLSPDDRARWAIRLTTTNASRVEWREPGDVTRSRERVVPASIYLY
jgi:hypothetical protein